MTHRNAPLSAEGRRRLIERCRSRSTATDAEIVAKIELTGEAGALMRLHRSPRHNGKVERYNRIIAEAFLYARTWTSDDQRRDALAVWNIHYNYHRPHSGADGQPPAARLSEGVTNVVASYS